MIESAELWPAMEALHSKRFHFLITHILHSEPDAAGYFTLTAGEAMRLCLADRLQMFGLDNDTQQAVMVAWADMLNNAGTHWHEAIVDDTEYTPAFFSVSDYVYSSMPGTNEKKFYDAQDGKWIDVLPGHAETIMTFDLTEMMLRMLSRINARRAKDGEDSIDLRPAPEVASS